MKTPLGTEVYLGPGHIVLDGVAAPAKGAQHPLFLAHVYSGANANKIIICIVKSLKTCSSDYFFLRKLLPRHTSYAK